MNLYSKKKLQFFLAGNRKHFKLTVAMDITNWKGRSLLVGYHLRGGKLGGGAVVAQIPESAAVIKGAISELQPADD